MSSQGGDSRYLPERELPGDARLYIPSDGLRDRAFEPLTVTPLPVRRDPRIVRFGGAVALLAMLIAGMAFWLLRPWSATSSSPTIVATTPAPPSADPQDEARLFRLLPPGYPAGSCKPAAPPKNALAQIHCTKMSHTGAPDWTSYTLLPDENALEAAFNDVVDAAVAVVCPGNIQSPGPWRRNTAPEKVSGMLICGMHEGRVTVAWTDNDKSVFSTAKSFGQAPNLSQLYAWWSIHS